MAPYPMGNLVEEMALVDMMAIYVGVGGRNEADENGVYYVVV